MGFLEDLKNGDIKSIILIIFSILLFHQYWCISNLKLNKDNKEHMADLSVNIKGFSCSSS